MALLLDGGGLGGGVAAAFAQQARIGADLHPRLVVLRTPPSRPSSIEEEGEDFAPTAWTVVDDDLIERLPLAVGVPAWRKSAAYRERY
jgi:hypothetical protein